MTDTPGRPPEKPTAPESAATETPARPGIPEQAAGAARTAPQWNAAPGWAGSPTGPVPGWEWNHGWIPKPGIIPLRPLRVGEIIGGAVALYRDHWRTLLPITAVVAVVTQVATTLIVNALPRPEPVSTSLTPSADPAADLHKNLNYLVDLVPQLAVTELISIVAGTLATAMLILVVSKAVIGRPAPLSEVWRAARPRIPRLIGLTALIALVVGGVLAGSLAPALLARSGGASDGTLAGLSTLVLPGALLALWLAVSMVLAAPALMLERQGVRESLARSFRLVRRSWWRVFGIILLVAVLSGIMTGVIQTPLVVVFGSSYSAAAQIGDCIGAIIATTVTLPFLTGASALLYIDQRIRREALDLDLAAAAGVPGYAPVHP